MKPLLIICAIVLTLQLGVLGYSFSGGSQAPTEAEIENGDWDAAEEFPLTAAADGLLDVFRPRIKVLNNALDASFPPDESRVVRFTHRSDDARVIARFGLTSGVGALISYSCDKTGKGFTCPQQIACLCNPSAQVSRSMFSRCGRSRPKIRGGRCEADSNVGEVLVYTKSGDISITALGERAARLERK